MTLEGVNVFGPVAVASGLGTAVRGHLRAMWHAGLRTRVYPLVFTAKQETIPFELPRESTAFDVAIVYANADATDFAFAHYATEIRKARYRIGVWVWELAAARPEHSQLSRQFDELWVPSTFNQRAFAAITRIPVHVVPYVVEASSAGAVDFRARLEIPSGAFVFFYMFDASSFVERKNPQALLRAFEAEFGRDRDAFLVLKAAYLQANSDFARDLDLAQRKMPNLRVVRETLDEDLLLALLGSADCYVSPHRSEGFGFTVAEAMTLGKPVVATDYGATRDFVNVETAFPVEYRLQELEHDLGPYLAGAVWAAPSEADLARQMRRVRAEPDEARKRAKAAREIISGQYSLAAVAAKIRERLQSAQLPLRA